MNQNVRNSGGLFEAIRWMEERIGTSLDRVGAGDPEAIAIMERNLLYAGLRRFSARSMFRTGRTISQNAGFDAYAQKTA